MNHKPATPLPWVSHEQGDADEFVLLTADRTKWIVAFRLNGEQYLAAQRQNIAYLVHAAHAYEKLILALREARGRVLEAVESAGDLEAEWSKDDKKFADQIGSLLVELGEAP